MSSTLPWDLEERVEDALVAYLKTGVSSDIKVYAGGSTEVLQFPCAVASAVESNLLSPGASWSDPRSLTVKVFVLTEAAASVAAGGTVTKTARERNAEARASVIAALAIKDSDPDPPGVADICGSTADKPHGLAALLDVQMIPGVWIDHASVSRFTRSVDADTHIFSTEIEVAVIAHPVAIGGA